ncbi:MAG TPA: hypothetical protein VD706_01140 [Candidatus Saccharimonadales bacterium]|nr:hypothetical protein [Candidatus Saccharimonadales bacterium]
MPERVERVSKVTTPASTEQVTQKEVREVSEVAPSGATLAERVIWYVAGVLLVLLAFRFALALLGANPNNGFANFIYDASHPFVAPFFNLFGYDLQYGVSRFETFTLVAMAVYALVAYGLAKLVTLGKAEGR